MQLLWLNVTEMSLVPLIALTVLVTSSTAVHTHNPLTPNHERLRLTALLKQVQQMSPLEDKHTISGQEMDHLSRSHYQVESQGHKRGWFRVIPKTEGVNKVLTSLAVQHDNVNKEGTSHSFWDGIFNFDKKNPKTTKLKYQIMVSLQNIMMKLKQQEKEQRGPTPTTQYISFLVRKLLPHIQRVTLD